MLLEPQEYLCRQGVTEWPRDEVGEVGRGSDFCKPGWESSFHSNVDEGIAVS